MNNFWIHKQINANLKKSMFKYYELGLLGCGQDCLPYIDMRDHVKLPDNVNDIANECRALIKQYPTHIHSATNIIPKYINNKHLITHYYLFLEQYLTQEEIDSLQSYDDLNKRLLEKYDCNIFESIFAPRFTSNWYEKGKDSFAEWSKIGQYPNLKSWVESLRTNIFDEIGRIIIFNVGANQPVLIHRDYHYRPHKVHFINFQLESKPRFSYVYDEVAKQKVYIHSPCYTFNETDLHGVDSCITSRFSLRIDGVFKSELQSKLKYKDGFVWNTDYKSADKLNQIKMFEPDFND